MSFTTDLDFSKKTLTSMKGPQLRHETLVHLRAFAFLSKGPPLYVPYESRLFIYVYITLRIMDVCMPGFCGQEDAEDTQGGRAACGAEGREAAAPTDGSRLLEAHKWDRVEGLIYRRYQVSMSVCFNLYVYIAILY